jgi:hypothetical protein
MKLRSTLERFIYQAPAWKLISVILLLTLFKTGIWCIPNLSSSRAIALNPFVNPFADPNTHYLYWSWLEPFLAWSIGATGGVAFFVFHLCFAAAFTALFMRLLWKRLSGRDARTALILFAALPVSATTYFWVSMDAITLFLMTLVLAFPRRLVVVFFVALALGLQHFEQSFCGAAGVLIALLLSRRRNDQTEYSVEWALALLLGTLLGKLVLLLLFRTLGVTVNSGRLFWLKEHFLLLLGQFFFHFHFIVWSVLGCGWIAAIRYAETGKQAVPFFVSFIALMSLLVISGDQTRVSAICTFFLVAVYWLLNPEFLNQISNKLTGWIFLLWAISPWFWVRGGTPMWSAAPYDFAYLLHQIFGWFDLPPDPAAWPFQP